MRLRRPPRGGSRGVRGTDAQGTENRFAEPDSDPAHRAPRDPRAAARTDAAGRPRRDLRGGAGKLAGPLLAGGAEILAIAREMVALPADLWMRAAERLGELVLAAVRWLWPFVLAALDRGRDLVSFLSREVTPARGVATVTVVAAALLAVTQFVDYREVRAGVPAYAEVDQVAPAPTVDGTRETAGSAHLYVLVLAAIAAAMIVVLSMQGRWRMARLLFPLGLAGVAVALLVDAPAGLDEGIVATQFQGAEARLLGPFWVEVTASAVLALCGPLLSMALRPAPGGRGAARARAPRHTPVSGGRMQGARS